jgi:hypothetical protein
MQAYKKKRIRKKENKKKKKNKWKKHQSSGPSDMLFCFCRYVRSCPATGCNASGLRHADGLPWSADAGPDDASAFQMIAPDR